MVAEICFLGSVGVVFYTYLAYPALVFMLSRFFVRPVRQSDFLPQVSVIIAAHNEEMDIAAKIENTLASDYPPEKLEIVVASDCSTDQTDEIVASFGHRGVILYRQPTRQGKTIAQYKAVKVTKGEFLVFSDATTMYEPNAIRRLVRNFADPDVGCVAGQLVYVDRSSSSIGRGCSSYWSYEKAIKESESRLGSLIGVSGCLYGVRRSCYAQLAHDMIDDFVVATEIHLQGLRTVYEPEAVCTEDTNNRGHDEFRMRVRVMEQTMRALHRYRETLSLRRHGMFAFQMISHKVLRYAVPAFLIIALVSNLLFVNVNAFYSLTFTAQLGVYGVAFIGWFGERVGVRLGMLGFPYYFLLVNAASLAAFVKFLQGDSHVVWESSREPRETRTTVQ